MLDTLKRADYDALLTGFAASLVDEALAPQGITRLTRERMDIYRNNARLNRIAALTDAFPNVAQLVGTEYFGALARAYIDRTPAKSANLHDDGAELPAFIRGFAPAANLPYLSDVAEVDWLLHRAYFAADATAIDRSTLAELGSERFAAASLRFMPSVGLGRSLLWPIADILRMHAGGPPACLGVGGQSMLIWREGFSVRWQALAQAEADTMAALMNGTSVQEAFSSTSADATSLLAQLFGHRLVLAIEQSNEDRL
jgi:hypothetical protein